MQGACRIHAPCRFRLRALGNQRKWLNKLNKHKLRERHPASSVAVEMCMRYALITTAGE